MKYVLLALLFIIPTITFSQNPPPAAIPTQSNKKLITKIITISNIDNYYYDYCVNKVYEKAAQENWTEEKKNKIIASINFQQYNFTIYNTFALYSEEELLKIIAVLTILNEKKSDDSKFMLINSMMLSNFEVHLENILAGKMISSKG